MSVIITNAYGLSLFLKGQNCQIEEETKFSSVLSSRVMPKTQEFRKVESEKTSQSICKNAQTLTVKEIQIMQPSRYQKLKVHIWQGCGVLRMFICC